MSMIIVSVEHAERVAVAHGLNAATIAWLHSNTDVFDAWEIENDPTNEIEFLDMIDEVLSEENACV